MRHVKQVIDLLHQIGDVAPNPETARRRARGRRACFRGVVAASSLPGREHAVTGPTRWSEKGGAAGERPASGLRTSRCAGDDAALAAGRWSTTRGALVRFRPAPGRTWPGPLGIARPAATRRRHRAADRRAPGRPPCRRSSRSTWSWSAPPPGRRAGSPRRARCGSSSTAAPCTTAPRPPSWSPTASSSAAPTSSRGAIRATAGSRCRCTPSPRRERAGPCAAGSRRACTSRTRASRPDRPGGRSPRRGGGRCRSTSTASPAAGARELHGRGASRRPCASCSDRRSVPGGHVAPIPRRAAGTEYPRRSDAVRGGTSSTSRRRTGRPAPVLHEPRRARLRAREPARGREGRAVRAVLALAQEPAPAVPRRVRRRPRPHRRPHRRRQRRPESAPRSSTTACSSSTATTPSRSSAACTSRASRRRTCSRRSSSGAGSWRTSSSRRATSRTTAGSAAATATTGRPRCSSRRSARATSPRSTRCSTRYAELLPTMLDWARERYPKEPGDSDFVYKQTIKAKACDARPRHPAGGHAVERRDLRHRPGVTRRCCCACAPIRCPRPAATPAMMLEELRKVIPSFLTRVDRAGPRAWRGARYLAETRDAHRRARRTGSSATTSPSPARRSRSPTSTPRARTRCSRRSATRTRTCPRTRSSTACAASAPTSASRCSRAYVGERANRRHKPGRAFERTDYRFDVLADYGAFRDLQRHRMLTIEWQPLSAAPRLRRPRAGRRRRADATRSSRRWSAPPRCTTRWRSTFPEQASYAVSLAYRVRFVMQMNAREAMHLIELRTAPQGHPRTAGRARRCTGSSPSRPATTRSRRRCATSTTATYELERLDAERAAEARAPRRVLTCHRHVVTARAAGRHVIFPHRSDLRRRASVQVTASRACGSA